MPDQKTTLSLFHPVEYKKAVAGSFDVSWFINPTTGKFKFPDYTKNWRGMVHIKDNTQYKTIYFGGLDTEEKKKFSLADFELNFTSPDFEIESFPAFFQRIPGASFNNGIGASQVLALFQKFLDFLTDQETEYFDAYYLEPAEAHEGIAVGLLTAIDVNNNPQRHWFSLSEQELDQVCASHGIEPGPAKTITIARILEAGIVFPYAIVFPSSLLEETYWTFIDLYIEDIRDHIGHFHPFYFEHIWNRVWQQCDEPGVRIKVTKILEQPYWSGRILM